MDWRIFAGFQRNLQTVLTTDIFRLLIGENTMALNVKEENGFKYVDEGTGQVLMLLHGLFGALSNWEGVVDRFSKQFRVVIPMLPIY